MSIENPDKKEPEAKPVEQETAVNPNSIGEVMSVGRDLPTRPDKIYRSVAGDAAITDLFESGLVRNAKSAGVKANPRYGDKVFLSKGAEGKFHIVTQDGFVIEAPYNVGAERVVGKDDVTAIYTKNEKGEVVEVLSEWKGREIRKVAEVERQRVARKAEDEARIAELKKELTKL